MKTCGNCVEIQRKRDANGGLVHVCRWRYWESELRDSIGYSGGFFVTPNSTIAETCDCYHELEDDL